MLKSVIISAGDDCKEVLDQLAAEVAARDAMHGRTFDWPAVERAVRGHLERWRTLLTTNVEDGRQLLRRVLAGPVRFTPERRSYAFAGDVSIGRLLSGTAEVAPFMASLTGFEPGCNATISGKAA